MHPRLLYVNGDFRDGVRPLLSFPVRVLEDAVLDTLEEVSAAAVFPAAVGSESTAAMELEDVEAKLAEWKVALDGNTKITPTVVAVVERLDRRRAELAAAVESEGETAAAVARAAASVPSIRAALAASANPDYDRRRLQTAIQAAVSRVDCLFLRDGRRQVAVAQLRFPKTQTTRTVVVYYRSEDHGRNFYRPAFTSPPRSDAVAGLSGRT
jgi:hypothetical protein